MRKRILLFALILFSCLALFPAQDVHVTEADRLAQLLDWRPGSVVADVGAGDGEMTLVAAERVGPTGRVYATEIDPKKIAHLEKLAAKQQSHNLTVVTGAKDSTKLPSACCDSIFLRRVYHHFTGPAVMDASLFQALKPGGRLAVIDFPPRADLPAVEGVPQNRGGHGVPEKVLIEEVTAAGFHLESQSEDWPDNDFCVVFRKPTP